MAASVFFIIIPNQKIVVADLLAGRKPDPRLGKQAGQRSLHNNYLTLPVIFMMISNHYPIMFGHPWSPLIALGIVVAGGLIRHFFNVTNHGIVDDRGAGVDSGGDRGGRRADHDHRLSARRRRRLGDVTFADIQPIIEKHCVAVPFRAPDQRGFSGGAEGRGVRHARRDPPARQRRSSSRRCSPKSCRSATRRA